MHCSTLFNSPPLQTDAATEWPWQMAVAMSVASRRPRHAHQLQALAQVWSAAAGLDYQRTAATDEYNTMRAFSRMTGCGVEC